MRTIICLCLLLVSLSANANPLFFKSSYYILEFDRDGIRGEVSTDVRKNNVLGTECKKNGGVEGIVLGPDGNEVGSFYTGHNGTLLYYDSRGNYVGKRVKRITQNYDPLFQSEYNDFCWDYYDANDRFIARYVYDLAESISASKEGGPFKIKSVFIRQ